MSQKISNEAGYSYAAYESNINFMKQAWSAVSNFDTLCNLNVLFLSDFIMAHPNHGNVLDAESGVIQDNLIALNKNGLLTSDSQIYFEGENYTTYPYLQCVAKYEDMVTLIIKLREIYDNEHMYVTFFTKNLSKDDRVKDLGTLMDYMYDNNKEYTGVQGNNNIIEELGSARFDLADNTEHNNSFFDEVYCIVLQHFSTVYNPPEKYDLREDKIKELDRSIMFSFTKSDEGLDMVDFLFMTKFKHASEYVKEKIRKLYKKNEKLEMGLPGYTLKEYYLKLNI